jgi:cysteine desulfurase / selenocysteine lyase
MGGFKKDFPLLKNNPGLSYLDNAATTQKPRIVIDTLKKFYEESNANTHRGIYQLSEKATTMLENARKKIASLLNAESGEIIFVRSATEGLNQLANSLGELVGEKDNIVVTEMEHHSNFVPWQVLAEKKKADFRVVKYADLMNNGAEAISGLVDEKTRVVSFTHMSNVTGKILDAKKIARHIRKKNKDAIIIVDACQAAAHVKIDVEELGADFICMSAHKFYGPLGVGIVYGRKELLEGMEPFFYGGNMISAVTLGKSDWAEPPGKFEAGTLDAAGIIASAAALEYFYKNYDEIHRIEQELGGYLLEKIKGAGAIIIGHEDDSFGPIVSFNIEEIHPHDLATIVDRHNVCIRAGHHCAQPFMKALGLAATARASIACYNVKTDVDKLIEGVLEAKKILG